MDTVRLWEAGVDGAVPGIIMPAVFTPGARCFAGNAPGVAVDLAYHSGAGLRFTVPAGAFDDCVRISVTSLIETNPTPRDLVFAPGIGLISMGSALRLVSY